MSTLSDLEHFEHIPWAVQLRLADSSGVDAPDRTFTQPYEYDEQAPFQHEIQLHYVTTERMLSELS